MISEKPEILQPALGCISWQCHGSTKSRKSTNSQEIPSPYLLYTDCCWYSWKKWRLRWRVEVPTTELFINQQNLEFTAYQPLNTLIQRLSLPLFSEQTMLAQKANGTVHATPSSRSSLVISTLPTYPEPNPNRPHPSTAGALLAMIAK